MSNLLVRIFGWKATLHHGDPLVWDRWRWLAKRLRETHHDESVLDVGCGTGAFTIGTAKLGYKALGLSWDERNQRVAAERARISSAPTATFEICDVRTLDQQRHLAGRFDIVVCTENIEHIIDDFRLMRALAGCLKPGGRLFLTSPNVPRKPFSSMDYGPFPAFEDGRHVRRGYNRAMLCELCADAGLMVEEIDYISGPISVLGAYIMHHVQKISRSLAWLAILPLRPLPPLVDWWLGPLLGTPPFSIALEAVKPRRPLSADMALARQNEAA